MSVHIQSFVRHLRGTAWLVCAAALLLLPAIGRADPIEKLRHALQIRIDAEPALLAERRKLIHDAVEEVTRAKAIPQLRRAYFLREWSLLYEPLVKEGQLGPFALKREEIGKVLADEIRAAAGDGSALEKLALAILIAGIADEENQSGERKLSDNRKIHREKFARRLTEVVTSLARDKSHRAVRQAALHALGKITPEPAIAIPVLQGALAGDPETDARRLAAFALVELARNSRYLTRPERLATLDRAVAAAALGLQKNSDERTRGYCLQAIEECARGFVDFLSAPEQTLTYERDGKPKVTGDVREVLASLASANPRLIDALESQKVNLRLAGFKTLDQVGLVRVKWLQRFRVGPETKQDRAKVFADLDAPDPFASIFERDFRRIGALLSESDVRLRRGAIGLLEALAEQGEPAAEFITLALEDTDRAVRAAAARAIRQLPAKKIGPRAIRALGNLVLDADADLALIAAEAMETLGPTAAENVDKLAIVIANADPAQRAFDADIRARAMKALSAIGGTAAHKAYPAVLSALADDDVRVRRQAAQTIGQLGRPADAAVVSHALAALRKAFADSDREVRVNASEAIFPLTRGAKPR